MDKLKLLLWPFSLLYGGIMQVRNVFYDRQWFATRRFRLPVIAVGNLTVGGTGKTPHVEYLLRLLQNYKVATLSRGYKRATKGFIVADATSTAASLGDEPYQYHLDFPEVQVAVSESRVAGVEQLLVLQPSTQVIVLDDAMQHRAIEPSLNLLITDYNRLFYKDYILPAGLLREPKSGAARADAIIVSKCSDTLPASEREIIVGNIRNYSRAGVPVYFTGFRYGQLVAFGSQTFITKNVLLLTGIANAEPLKLYLEQNNYSILHHSRFPDHHQYTIADLDEVKKQLQQLPDGTVIVTTRKDAVKLLSPELAVSSKALPLFYIPIEVYFLEGGSSFDKMILEHVRAFEESPVKAT